MTVSGRDSARHRRVEWHGVEVALALGVFLGLIDFAGPIGVVAAENPELFSLETGWRRTNPGPIAVTQDSRVLWITEGPEAPKTGAYQLHRSEIRESLDFGRTWGPPRLLLRGTRDKIPGASVLLKLTSGKLLLIGARDGGYSMDGDPNKSLNEGFTQSSTDGGATWSKMRVLPTGERYLSDVLSAAQLTTGRVVFPFGYLTKEGPGRFDVSVVYSDDDGDTWHRSVSMLTVGGLGFESGATEPSVVELPDGRLWMLIRAQNGFQWESFSSDRGETWQAARPSRFPSSNSPAVLLRLRSGRIVVVWNDSVRSAYARQCLVMAASDDGSRTFYGFREIAHTESFMTSPESPWRVYYPWLAEAPDGKILMAYNYGDGNFNQAKLVRIDPSWLKEGSLVEDFRDGRGAWCRWGAGGDSLVPPEDNQAGASLQIDSRNTTGATRSFLQDYDRGDQKQGLSGIVRNFPLASRGEMRLKLTVLKPQAYLMWHDTFLDPGKVDEACLRVRFAEDGHMFVAAGEPSVRKLGQVNERGPEYSYLAYPLENETLYPMKIRSGERFSLKIRWDVSNREAQVSVNDGKEVRVPLGHIFGLCYFGIAAKDGGSIRLRKFESSQQ